MSSELPSKRDIKAERAAEKARAKAQRSWPARHKFLTGLGGVVAIAVVATIATSGGGNSTTPAAQGSTQSKGIAAPKADKKLPGVGAKARDGQFEFTVKNVTCGKKVIGDQYLNTKAQGQFCLVKVHIKNVGDSSQMLDSSSQAAFDAKGNKFSASGEAAAYMGDQGQTFLNEINPGNAVDGTVVYDVPKGTKLEQLELHDSAFSGGVKVTLN